MSSSWPVTLRHGDVVVRPLRVSDAKAWQNLRIRNSEWVAEWEATAPMPSSDPPPTFRQSARRLVKSGKAGSAMPFVIEFHGEMVGQVNVGDIVYGSLRGCHIGYWISSHVANRGIMSTAVALVVDYLFDTVRLHRIEIAVRPENGPSNRVAQRLGFGYEGLRPAFLHINNAWRDHNIYVLLEPQRKGRVIDLAPQIKPIA